MLIGRNAHVHQADSSWVYLTYFQHNTILLKALVAYDDRILSKPTAIALLNTVLFVSIQCSD